MQKFIDWSLILMIGLCACGNSFAQTPTEVAQVVETTQPDLSTPEPDSVILTAVPSAEAAATKKFIPKHNDLIFVEFFAVT